MTKSDTSRKDGASKGDDLAAKVAAAAAGDAKTTELLKKIADLEDQLKKASDVASRAQAELQNAKARLERESGDMRKFAAEAVLLRLLPTIDNLQRALKHLPGGIAGNEWVKGIVAIEQDFLRQVGDMGLQRFESLGQPVDADRHEVLMQGPGKANTVIEVLEDGYELHGKVVRPAKVKAGDGSVA